MLFFFSQCSNFNKTHKENVTQGGEMILRSQSGQKQHIHLPVTLPLLSEAMFPDGCSFKVQDCN